MDQKKQGDKNLAVETVILTEEQKRAEREKGEATRQRRWEQRQEKKRQEEQRRLQVLEAQRVADEGFMREAVRQARKAGKLGDVPIGCVIVKDGKIISRGYNRRNADKTVLSHAEVTAIRRACAKLGDWRLEDCTLYVTLEPCPMCAGAIVQARIPTVVIGSRNPKAGCAGSVMDLFHQKGLNHQVELREGILGETCSDLLTNFFLGLRKKK
ncbi:tRNA adenosine(34) deaminase TadA [Brotaphodocola sp.]|uniref:tRNA adenosine(34) deaminase TadA n=1 Tax=Brotaphodocola sp. TaxID=3073577 RepID=UPI003D7D0AE9